MRMTSPLRTALYGVACLLCMVGTSTAFTSPSECLAHQLNVSESSDSSSSGSYDADATTISFLQCANQANWNTIPPLPDTSAPSPPPSTNQTISCAATCGSIPSLRRTENNDVQFILYQGDCYCLNETVKVPTTNDNASTCLQQSVFALSFVCWYVNASLGCGAGCTNVAGCCIPNSPPSDDNLPSYYRTMIQWVAIVVIVLALVEAIVYGCLRRRAIAQRRARYQVMRPKSDAKELTERLLSRFPASPSAAQEPSIAEDACSICLELLNAEPSLMLPCRHNIHKSCLREFITHQLTRTNEVLCPMCRAPVVEEDEDDESNVENGVRGVRVAQSAA